MNSYLHSNDPTCFSYHHRVDSFKVLISYHRSWILILLSFLLNNVARRWRKISYFLTEDEGYERYPTLNSNFTLSYFPYIPHSTMAVWNILGKFTLFFQVQHFISENRKNVTLESLHIHVLVYNHFMCLYII